MPVQLSDAPQTAADIAAQEALAARGAIPEHVAIIMDGNGRWAKARGKRRASGHKVGVESVREIVEASAQVGIQHLTLYTFSTENWNRPKAEVMALMELLIHTIRREAKKLHENGIRLRTLGDLSRLPARAQREMQEAVDMTAGNTRMSLGLALSYSGRWEITEAARALARQAASGELSPEAITEEDVARALPTSGVPDPDLLIRTGGEMRVSNFLLWQIAYSEIVVTQTLWPDFRREQLYEAIRDFQNRDRRFGRVEEA
ncbi:isoprenyl transferase [Rubricoccus marinus]|uniref:Isoprenyl transferase n=1 Tax=Rubricoccus marinus TaxID=716817 RepID=A0A259TYU2_9BACT|nr:isoprenyl transferase [Rubricoccus marinus]OZC02943.1 di-trans,poly-cis-decaprenylcistransferase [Rubricoccus marinus]